MVCLKTFQNCEAGFYKRHIFTFLTGKLRLDLQINDPK